MCAEVAETLSYYYAEPTIRFTRQTDERDFVKIGQETRRVVRSRKGARLRRCDNHVKRRSTTYEQVVRLAMVRMSDAICNGFASLNVPACEFT